MNASPDFAGKVLLVTGGGSGVGAAVAHAFAAEGGRVAVLDLDGPRAMTVAKDLPESIAFAVDVTDEQAVKNAVAQTLERFGRIDCVVNSAGYVILRRFRKLSLDEWNQMLAVHVTGTFLVCRETAEALTASGSGAIVNVSSIGGLAGRPYLTAYSTAKAAVIGLSRQLAAELAPAVRVNAIAPGDTRTPLSTPLWKDLGSGDEAAGARQVASANLLGRVAEPEEIASAICFLLSNRSSYLTGTLLIADGGFTAV